MLRTFIAIELNQNIRNVLGELQSELEKLSCDIKWVDPNIAHLTLRFIGYIAEEQVQAIKKALSENLASHSAFEISVDTIGTFPDKRRPRVIWLGLNDPNNSATAIADDINKILENLSIPKEEERAFKPHITIGRVRSPKNIKLLTEALDILPPIKKVKQQVTKITFLKSTLTPSGPVYESLGDFELKGADANFEKK